MRRVLLIPLLLTLAACPKETPRDGALKLTVSYKGFLPKCVRVSAKDVDVTGEVQSTELLGKGSATGGSMTVAIFRNKNWGKTLEVTAEAFERANGAACDGAAAVRQKQSFTLGTDVNNVELELVGQDTDGDGFVAVASGGTDCDDTLADVKPGALDTCNDRDDNCDGRKDETFDIGAVCTDHNLCQGAWACDGAGGRECKAQPFQWYPDKDKDGKGDSSAAPKNACLQPAGHVPNSDDCDDNNAQRFRGNVELCTPVDEDCDGNPYNGLNVGALCTGVGGCEGTRQCAGDGSVMCNAPTPLTLYVDADNDTYGAKGSNPSMLCQQPATGYSTNNTDCADNDATRNPGATERCNALDDDCDNDVDEGFNLGASCTPNGGCTGENACDVDAGVAYCKVITPATTYYPDEDLDQRGQTDAGVPLCSPPDGGLILTAGDCDDGDPYTYTGADEICDLKDNNCDGQVDGTPPCPAGGGTWATSVVGENNKDWNAISLWGDGGVWVVGESGRRALRLPGESTFSVLASGCAKTWVGVWAHPETGTAYLGGDSSGLGIQTTGSTTCNQNPPLAQDFTTGLMGFGSGGTLNIFGVGRSGNNNDGRSFQWDGTTQSPAIMTHNAVALWDVHGLSPNLLFAVGGPNDNEPRIFRWNVIGNIWDPMTVDPTSLDQLQAVWIVNAKLGYAVGKKGSVLKWDGTSWTRMPFPNSSDLRGVLAFGSNSVYVIAAGGGIFRFNGQAWTELTNVGGSLRDIAGTSPDNIWVVGNNGRVIHWPQ
ncbi:putative metal-binding motif-containing protein [Myxococcaceae bacterium GXIMD 01537]